ncbi:hypothetical protein PbJCM13498_04340 [Prolixibacter bellariivorans]|uniref:Uncharacterized protein n=1 Tax=Prolixibacter bellariivorans TaxID=314319 RepID=A0A5M4AVJ0_9BACT|nr:hypothetical protein [Prolixibacter bellariivorans]GET31571.1 hypothetical protein PbJCM13498_04340 [Prolixibacter bellariivorans]
MKPRIKNTHFTLTIIGWLQVVGGIAGLGLMAYLMLKTGTINGAILLMFLLGLGLYGFSIYSGKRLLTDGDKKTGIILSIINQVPQIIQWSLLGYALTYASGFQLAIGMANTGLSFGFSISSFKMAINSGGDFLFRVNFTAIVVIGVLANILAELKQENVEESPLVTSDEQSV